MTAVVVLDALPATTFATEALRRLQAQARSALVVDRQGAPYVLKLQDIVGALRQARADVQLGDIPPSLAPLARVGPPLPPEAMHYSFMAEEQTVAQRFFEARRHILVTAVHNGQARVITYSEVVRDSFNEATTLCTCRTTHTHVWYDWEVTNPPRCNRGDGDLDCAP